MPSGATPAPLEILGRPAIASLAVEAGLADGFRSLDAAAMAAFFSPVAPLDPAQAAWFARFDLIVSYVCDTDGVFARRIAECSPARFVVGPHRPDETAGLHASDAFLAPLRALGLTDANPEPQLRFPAPTPLAREFHSGPWLAAHPGSGSPAKNWPETHWRRLLETVMAETDWKVLLIGGEAEAGRLERLTAGLPSTRFQLADSLPLPELARRMQCCAGFCGHDSGISHLAAALGLPGIALWGPSRETVWRPQSPRFNVLRSPSGLAGIRVETVFSSLAEILQRPGV